MKFKVLLEELDKKKFKESKDKFVKGTFPVKKYVKEKGIKETHFEKTVDLDEDFYQLVAESQARAVINHVNKAFRAYGYKTDLQPIPHEFDWHLIKNSYGHRVAITTSSFNKGVTAADLARDQSKKAYKSHELAQVKSNFLMALLGNADYHMGNHVIKKGTLKSYAIDFGLAFQLGFKDINFYDKESKSKAWRWANYLNFWEMYIEHNEDYLQQAIRDDRDKMSAKLQVEFKKIGYSKMTDYFIERLADLTTDHIMRLHINMISLKEEVIKQVRKMKEEKWKLK